MRGKLILILVTICILNITIFGCAKPNDPAVVVDEGSIMMVEEFFSTAGQVRDIDVKGDKVYCAEDQGGFSVFNFITETEVLHYIGLIENARLIRFIEESNLLFLYDRYGSPAQIRIYDLTDEENLAVLPPIIGNTGGIEAMECFDNQGSVDLYITRNDTDFEFKKLTWDGFYTTPQYIYNDYSITLNGFDMDDDYIYLAYEQLGLNITDRATGDVISITDSPGDARDVKIVDNVAYICDRHAGITLMDVSDPNDVNLLENIDTSGYTQDLDFSGNLLAVASGGGGVYLYDITDRENPQLLDHLDTSDIGYVYKVKFAQGFLIVGTRDGVAKISISSN